MELHERITIGVALAFYREHCEAKMTESMLTTNPEEAAGYWRQRLVEIGEAEEALHKL